jgi:hypothetical protein
MDDTGIISEQYPEVLIQKLSAPKVKEIIGEILNENDSLSELYFTEAIWAVSSKEYIGGMQNYPLLQGQRNNLYKCIISNSLDISGRDGRIGLLHPEEVFSESKAGIFRSVLFSRLEKHYQFINETKLFTEVHNNTLFDVCIYGSRKDQIEFDSINNLFNPKTIDLCYISDGNGICNGYKMKTESGQFVWNEFGHSDRIVRFNKETLEILRDVFYGSKVPFQEIKLTSIHANSIVSILKKMSLFKTSCRDYNFYATDGWNQTNAVKDRIIKKEIKSPIFEDYEMIYSGPNFHVANPCYKTSRPELKSNKDYDVIAHSLSYKSPISRTNYLPDINFKKNQKNVVFGRKKLIWIETYRLGFSEMISIPGERTLQSFLLPPKSSHINTVYSALFKNQEDMIELAALTSSIIFDFYVKIIGKGHFNLDSLNSLPLGVSERFRKKLSLRVILLNCLDSHYAELWGESWVNEYKSDSWSIVDSRLSLFNQLTSEWSLNSPLRNWFERRQALLEIDVLTAIAMGMNLDELILIYNVQFPVLQQNEDDTWFDQNGDIVFTCSKGLNGVGVDRPIWNTIKDLKAGDTFEHIIEKSELYKGKKVTYYAPFDKCDRVEDYKTAWAHFEEVFKER